jgi:sugar phosphate isomerase/epimerase
MKLKIGGLINNEGNLNKELKALKSLGYDYGEFGFGAPKEFVKEYKKNYKKYSQILPISVVHLPRVDFTKEEIENIKILILECLKIRCRNFVFHFFTIELIAENKITKERINGLKELAIFTKKQKVNLILENTISVKVKDLENIFNKVKGMYFCLDTGHANLTKEKNLQISFLNFFGDRLKHMHVHDNIGGIGKKENDLHLPIGYGNINFPQIFKKLKKIKYSGNITLEIRDFSEKGRKISINRIKELLY